MTILELINLGNTFEWNYPKMYNYDGTISDCVSEDKIVSQNEDYIQWLYKVKRMFQKEYSADVMFDEVIELTSYNNPNTYPKHIKLMAILHSVENEPQLCKKAEQLISVPAIEINNNINIGITLNTIAENLTSEQLAELKDYFNSNPKDKKGFIEKLLSFGADATTILSNILGTEPIWNAIKNLFSK